MKAKIGRIYVSNEDSYVLLKTKLGYIALDIKTGNTWGGLKPTVDECVHGLKETVYFVDMDKSR